MTDERSTGDLETRMARAHQGAKSYLSIFRTSVQCWVGRTPLNQYFVIEPLYFSANKASFFPPFTSFG